MKWTLVLLNSTLPRTIQWTPPYARPPPPPPTTIPYSKHSVSQGVDLHFSGTPSNPLCCALQLSLTANSVNHGVGSLITALQPTLYDWVDSTLVRRNVGVENFRLQPTLYDWVDSTLPPVLRHYSLQRTVSTMVWALSLMHSNLLCTIEWTPPYPLCYTLQLFFTVNSVNHGVGYLINALQTTLYDWLDSTLPSTLYDWLDSTLPPVLRPTTIPYSEHCQPCSGPSY